MYNPNFNSPEFGGIKNAAGLNRFILSVKQWVERTNSLGIIAKAGRYGGTYAHKDIAFEFATWVSPQFKLIDEGVAQRDRLIRLNQIAINQMRILENDDNRNLLKWRRTNIKIIVDPKHNAAFLFGSAVFYGVLGVLFSIRLQLAPQMLTK